MPEDKNKNGTVVGSVEEQSPNPLEDDKLPPLGQGPPIIKDGSARGNILDRIPPGDAGEEEDMPDWQ